MLQKSHCIFYSVENHKSWLALVQHRDQGRPVHLSWPGNTQRFLCSCLQQWRPRPGSFHSAIWCSAPACSTLQSQHGHVPQALLPGQERNHRKDKTHFPTFRHPLLFRMDILRLHRINPIQRIKRVQRAALVFDILNKIIYQTKIKEC